MLAFFVRDLEGDKNGEITYVIFKRYFRYKIRNFRIFLIDPNSGIVICKATI